MGGAGKSIPGAIDETIFSLYTHYESDHHGAYDVILGKSVKPVHRLPRHDRQTHSCSNIPGIPCRIACSRSDCRCMAECLLLLRRTGCAQARLHHGFRAVQREGSGIVHRHTISLCSRKRICVAFITKGRTSLLQKCYAISIARTCYRFRSRTWTFPRSAPSSWKPSLFCIKSSICIEAAFATN